MLNKKKKEDRSSFFIYLIGDIMFLIAHRGNNDHGFSENSKKAILNSLKEEYIDGVEFDVHITKDNKIVLIHDCVIDFISEGSGLVKSICLFLM